LNGQILVHILDCFLRAPIPIELPIILVTFPNRIDKSLQSRRVVIADEFVLEFLLEGLI